jgi:hypothetical protein
LKLKVIHPANPYYKQKLVIEQFKIQNGSKRVILRTNDGKRLSLPLDWTDFTKSKDAGHFSGLLIDCKHLLILCNTVNSIERRLQKKEGEKIDKEKKRSKAIDNFRLSDQERVDTSLDKTKTRNRTNIRQNTS